MGMINGLRVLNAISSGTMTGAQLETYLATSTNLGSLRQLLQLRGQTQVMSASSTAMTAVTASSTAMTAVTASSTAMTAVSASSTAMTAVSASSTAMTAVSASSTATTAISGNASANNSVLGSSFSVGAYLDRVRIIGGAATDATLAAQATMTAVIASSTAMTAVIASSTAKMAMFNSDTALAAIASSATALASMRAATSYGVQSITVNGSATIPNLSVGGSYILLGVSSSNNPINGNPLSVSTRRTGSARANTGLYIASNASTATTTPLALPLVAPFNGMDGGGTGYTWNFGLIRCDV